MLKTTAEFYFLTETINFSLKFLRNQKSKIKNQKSVVKIISEVLSEAIKNRIHGNIWHALSTICYIKDASNKLNKNPSVLSFELIGILTFLLSISSDMDTNSFRWLKMHIPISNLKLK